MEEHGRGRRSVQHGHSAPNTNEIFIKDNTSPPKKSSVASLLLSPCLPGYTLRAGHHSWANSYLTYHFLEGLTCSHYCKSHLLALLCVTPPALSLCSVMADDTPKAAMNNTQLLVLSHQGKVLLFHGHIWRGNDITQWWLLRGDKALLKVKSGCFRFLLFISPASHLLGIYAWPVVTVDSPSLLCF